MQHIQRASCPDLSPSSAAYLAALIDGQARTNGPPDDPAHNPGMALAAPDGRDGNTLIWVEGAMAEPGPAAEHGRGMIVVAHGPGQAAAERSFVISYPVEAGGQAQRIPAVLGLLEAMGWSLLESRRRRTASGHANTAVLVNTVRPGGEQRLWLAEPVPDSRRRGHARKRERPHYVWPASALPILKAHRQVRAWTRGGASGDAAR